MINRVCGKYALNPKVAHALNSNTITIGTAVLRRKIMPKVANIKPIKVTNNALGSPEGGSVGVCRDLEPLRRQYKIENTQKGQMRILAQCLYNLHM